MKNIIVCLSCAAVVIVLDIIVSKKIWKTLLDYAGITFDDLRKHFEGEDIHFTSGGGVHGRRNSMRYRQRAITEYLVRYADNPDASLKLFNLFKYSSLPIPIAASVLILENFLSNIVYIIIVYGILLLIVLAFWIALNRFKRNNPIDESKLEKLEDKRSREEKPNLLPAKIFFAAVAIIMAGATVFTALGRSGRASNLSTKEPEFYRTDISDVLYEHGYNSSEVMATYWKFDNDKLDNLALGEKDGYRFEYYEYHDDKTTKDVYNSIINEIAPNVEQGAGSVFTIVLDGVYYYVEYKSNTVIFAYSPEGSAEIAEILQNSGYADWAGMKEEEPNESFTLPEWGAKTFAFLMVLVLTLIVKFTCGGVIQHSAGVPEEFFDEFTGSFKEQIKQLNLKSKRPFITKLYTVIYYVLPIPCLIMIVLSVASAFVDIPEIVFTKAMNYLFVFNFAAFAFNMLFVRIIKKQNQKKGE